MENPKVCLINDSFPPLIDGVANTVLNYAKVINEKGGKAIVAVPFYPGADDSDFPYKVIRYPSFNTERFIDYRAGYPFSFETFEKIKEEKVNIIHSHCPFASTVLARTLRETLDAPVVFTYHTKFDVDIERTVGKGYLKEKIVSSIVKNIEACDEVWVVSEGAGENLRSLGYKGDYIVMQNGVDIPKGKVSEEEISKATGKYEIPENVPVFLFVGRMAWYKGLDIILKSLSKLKEAGEDFRMIFIGGGLDFEEVKNIPWSLAFWKNAFLPEQYMTETKSALFTARQICFFFLRFMIRTALLSGKRQPVFFQVSLLREAAPQKEFPTVKQDFLPETIRKVFLKNCFSFVKTGNL